MTVTWEFYFGRTLFPTPDYAAQTVQGATIQYGRTSVTQDPQPTTLSATLLLDSSAGTIDLDRVAPNQTVAVNVNIPAVGGGLRFVGIITDVTVTATTVTFNAVSTGIYVLNRVTISSYNTFSGLSPNEGRGFGLVAKTLAQEAFAAAGLDEDVSQYPTVTGTNFPEKIWDSYNGDPRPVGGLINGYAAQTRGWQLWDTFQYGSRKSPPGTNQFYVELVSAGPTTDYTPALTLTADEIGYYWSTSTDTAVANTQTTVTYTPASAGTLPEENPPSGVYTNTNPRYYTISRLETELSTQLTELDAQAVANWNSGRGYNPAPIVTLELPMSTFSGARQDAIIDQLVGQRLWETPVLNPKLPTLWYLQGYTERVSTNSWTIQVRLAGLGNLWWGQEWDDVTPTVEWDDVDAALTWLDLVETIL